MQVQQDRSLSPNFSKENLHTQSITHNQAIPPLREFQIRLQGI